MILHTYFKWWVRVGKKKKNVNRCSSNPQEVPVAEAIESTAVPSGSTLPSNDITRTVSATLEPMPRYFRVEENAITRKNATRSLRFEHSFEFRQPAQISSPHEMTAHARVTDIS